MSARVPAGRMGIVLGVLLAAFVVPHAVLSGEEQTLAQRCGVSERNVASETVRLATARDIWLEFPAMMRAPMLETDIPATVIVFPSGYDLSTVTFGRPDVSAAKSAGVVLCVVDDAGYIALFTNVDPTGSRLTR